MPNNYSHAVVLQSYQALGLLDGSARLPSPYKNMTSTSQRKSVRRKSIVPAYSPPDSTAYVGHESMKMSEPSRTPSPSTDSSTQTAIPRRYSESPKSLSATSTSINHSRRNSDCKTIVSWYSSSSASLPAPSIVTQIYAPRLPSSPSQRHRRETSLTSSRSLSRSSNAPAQLARKPKLLDFTIQTTVNQPPASPIPAVSNRASVQSSPAEPSLHLDSLDFTDPVAKSTGTAGRSPVEANGAIPVARRASTSGRLYLDLSKKSNPSLRHAEREATLAVPVVPNRSISPASLTSQEEFAGDNDSEYFGSADESSEDGLSEDEQNEPLSPTSPTSLQSLEVIAPWELHRPSVAHYRLPQGFPGVKEDTTKIQSASSSVRGFSPDDAAPPPIARVRKGDLSAFLEDSPGRHSFSISRHLSALKPSFSLPFKRTFSLASRKSGNAKKPQTKAQQETDLYTHSVPYDYAVPAITPIETSNAASLLPPTSKALKAVLRKRASNQNFNGIRVYDDVVRGSVSTERANPATIPSLTADPTSPRGMQPSLRKRLSKISLRGYSKQPSDPLAL